MHWAAVALGGALGSLVRYALSSWMVRKYPAGTLCVNLIGCFLIGLLVTLSQKVHWPSPVWRAFIISGFIGALTTFSTYAWQTWELSREEGLSWGAINLASHLALGFAAIWAGVVSGSLVATWWMQASR